MARQWVSAILQWSLQTNWFRGVGEWGIFHPHDTIKRRWRV